jgi:3-oxoacyl-[acyl-carrier protein] reductase
MNLGLEGKTALLAGASAGLGGATARALAVEGVNLFISARGEARLEAMAGAIRHETGVKVTPIVADHGTKEGRAGLLAACPDPDILVTCSSPPRFTEDYREITETDWHATLATTMIGPIELMRSVVDGMVDRKFGRIVNIGTAAAKNPLFLRMLSGPPRSALVNYSVALSKRVARHDVVINNVLPGLFMTPGLEAIFQEEARKRGTTYDNEVVDFVRRWRVPAQCLGQPEDFGSLCAFLCSRHARYLIGQSIAIDGGLGTGLF